MSNEFLQHNLDCNSENHDKHLCYLTSQGFHLSDFDEFQELIKDPNFQCKHCGRQANSNQNLCIPMSL